MTNLDGDFSSASGQLVVSRSQLGKSHEAEEHANIVGNVVSRLLQPSGVGFALASASFHLNLHFGRGSIDYKSNSLYVVRWKRMREQVAELLYNSELEIRIHFR